MSVPPRTRATGLPKPAEATSLQQEKDVFRKEAIASLERKRKFGRDLLAYVTVNGVFPTRRSVVGNDNGRGPEPALLAPLREWAVKDSNLRPWD
jgi:hypothetical protein